VDDTEVWSAVDRRRAAVVDLLEGLSPTEWDTPSLCDGWRVRDVAAHLTMQLLTIPQLAILAIRHPGGTNRLIKDGSIDLARRYDTDELVERMRRLVGRHRPFPGLTCRESLIDAVGHTLDMAIPLERDISIPADEVAEAADRVVASFGTRNAKVFRAMPLTPYRLTATDHPWSTGVGPEVSGTMTDLFLLLTGRTTRMAHLRGPCADDLRGAALAT
jgi:uncharacterized protein (TIGR03083 family)